MKKETRKQVPKLISAEAEANFLLEAGDILSSSLDYEKTLNSVANLIVPQLADWFALYLVNKDGNLENSLTLNADRRKMEWIKKVQKQFPGNTNANSGAAKVVRSGEAELIEEIPRSLLVESSKTPEQLAVLEELKPKSYMCVPLTIHGKTLGALTLLISDSDRRYQKKDLLFAKRLARKIASAIDNSRLYISLENEVKERRLAERELKESRAQLEHRVLERTQELARQTEFSQTLLRAQSDLGDGVAVIDGKTQRFLYVNNALCEIYGYTRDEMLALPSFFSLTLPKEVAALKERLKVKLRGGSASDHYEMSISNKKGAPIFVEVSIKQIKNEEASTLIAIVRDITDRKRVEEMLSTQERRLREAQQIAQVGSWEWVLATDTISFSDEMCRIYALPKKSTVPYDTFLSYVHPQDREYVNIALRAALTDRKPFQIDLRIVRADGAERNLHTRGEFTFDSRGNLTGMFGTGQDITERKSLERNLRKWHHVFQHAQWGLIVGSPDGKKFEMINPYLTKMFGYATEEIIGKPIELLLSPAARKSHPKTVEIIRNQGYHIWETVGRKKDGTEFPVQVDLTVVKEDGKPMYYVGSVHDLTLRKMAEQELRRSREELEVRVEERTAELEEAVIHIDQERAKDVALLDSIADAVIAVDKEGRIMFANRVAEAMHGISQAEMLDKPAGEILKVTDETGRLLSLGEHPLGIALAGGKRVTGNSYFIISRKGARIPISISAAPIILDDKVIGAIGVFRDTTKEREVDRAKSEFVALASHQLRTPLTITSWYTEKLMASNKKNRTAKEKKYLEQLYHANTRMIDLVNALLNVSRIELGTLAINPTKTDLREISESVLSEFTPHIASKELRIERQYDMKLPMVKVDQQLLRIIFQNLFSNAMKYIDQGGRITIGLAREKKEILISVADNGYGIPSHQQSKLFSKLFRADNARERESDGTGLGLYIVKSITDQSGGKVWFQSQEGKGSTFYVTLPLRGMTPKIIKRDEESFS